MKTLLLAQGEDAAAKQARITAFIAIPANIVHSCLLCTKILTLDADLAVAMPALLKRVGPTNLAIL